MTRLRTIRKSPAYKDINLFVRTASRADTEEFIAHIPTARALYQCITLNELEELFGLYAPLALIVIQCLGRIGVENEIPAKGLKLKKPSHKEN